jgi:8-oxo-dGTP diphosphatase
MRAKQIERSLDPHPADRLLGLAGGGGMLILARHGEAGRKGGWGGPDLQRPLTPEGLDQAEGLVVRLDDYPVDRILSSPAVRCLQTVEPLARDRLLQVEEVAALGVDADAALVASRFVHGEASNAVLCTHGELIGRLFDRLVPAGLAVEEPLHWPKGSAWLLWRVQHRLHARFLAPLALDHRSYAG